MSRRFNAVRAVTAAENAERAAWAAFTASPDRTRDDVATAPVKGDLARGREVLHVATDGFVSTFDGSTFDWHTYHPDVWAALVTMDGVVVPVESPARIARRLVWERAAARLETARATLAALPPAGHKRRRDGSVYPVANPRQNAARKAGRDAFKRVAGRSLAFMGVALAFVALFLSACN